eukprot:1160034-Pelagomonas_calceolata.AAC.5
MATSVVAALHDKSMTTQTKGGSHRDTAALQDNTTATLYDNTVHILCITALHASHIHDSTSCCCSPQQLHDHAHYRRLALRRSCASGQRHNHTHYRRSALRRSCASGRRHDHTHYRRTTRWQALSLTLLTFKGGNMAWSDVSWGRLGINVGLGSRNLGKLGKQCELGKLAAMRAWEGKT